MICKVPNNFHASGHHGRKDGATRKPNGTPAARTTLYLRLGRRKARAERTGGSFIPRGIKVQIFKRQRERQSLYTFSPVTFAKLRCHLAVVAVSAFADLALEPPRLERTLVKKEKGRK